MIPVHEARFCESLPDGKVLCTLCPQDCRIPNNARGACRVRYNRDGRLYTLVYDKVVVWEVEPTDKRHPTGSAHWLLRAPQPDPRGISVRTAGRWSTEWV